MPGVDLASGAHAVPVGVLNYGWGPALLVGGFHGVFSPLLSDPVKLSLPIKFYQFIALILVGFTLRILNRKHWIALLAVVVLSTPNFSSVSEAIYYPNLSGIRFLSILVVLLLCASAAPPVVLGLGSALSMVYAPETGIVASSGAFIFVVLSSYAKHCGVRRLLRPLGAYLFGLSSFVFVSQFLGSLQNRGGAASASSFVSDFISGFGGISTLPSPLSILVFFFASAAVYRGFVRAGRGRARIRDAYQAAVGAMMLVWLIYYINRMHPYNLWFQSAFIVVLLAPGVGFSVARLLRCGSLFAKSYIVVAASLLIALSAEHLVDSALDLRELFYRVRAVSGLREDVTDIIVPRPEYDEVSARRRALEALPSRHEYLVVSHLSTDVRVLGFNEGMPWYDLFSDVLTRFEFERAGAWIDLHGPRYVVVDDPDGIIAREVPPQTGQLQALVKSLSSYREADRRTGWVYLERKQP